MGLRNEKSSPGPTIGVSVCVVQAGRVLLTQRARPPFENLWSLPGGHVKRGEGLRDAALRELKEETGINASLGEIIGWNEIIRPEKHIVIAVFTAQFESGEAVAADDAKAVRWVDHREIHTLELTPGLAGIVNKAFGY
jgi:8-oxo-dGTP diphosphatase